MQIQSYRTETVLSNLSNKDTRIRIVLIQKQFYKTIRTTASSSLLSEYVQLDPRSAHTHSHNAVLVALWCGSEHIYEEKSLDKVRTNKLSDFAPDAHFDPWCKADRMSECVFRTQIYPLHLWQHKNIIADCTDMQENMWAWLHDSRLGACLIYAT